MIDGQWFAKGSSARYDAALEVGEERFVLSVEGAVRYEGLLTELQVATRLGNVQRKITFLDGSLFTTQDNEAVDNLFAKELQHRKIIHILETKSSLIVVALVLTVAFGFSFFKWGIPWTSTRIAHALPQETNELISLNTLEFLDTYLFETSKIPDKQEEEIRAHFQSNVVPLADPGSDINYKLHFRLWRDGNVSIPNAFALPSGDIILTDKFVELAETQEEIDSVLLHEMGHVVHRHTLETVIESTFISVAAMMIVGDNNGLADMGVGLGSLLVSSKYSRGHESEADTYAFKHMLKGNIDPMAFSDIMNRMSGYMEKGKSVSANEEESKEEISDYISTHPTTKQRVEIARQYSKCFKQGLRDCTIVEKQLVEKE